ncbi:MAG: NAD(P)H-dependent oxidoreductase [Candidatus Limnocylindrales bacterium]
MSAILRALEARAAAGDPIRVGLVGAGFAGRGFAARVLRRTAGMHIVAIANRTVTEAERAYREAGIDGVERVESATSLAAAIAAGRPAITDDPTLLTASPAIELIVEATGEVEFGAGVATAAIAAGKHVVLINAELDSTLGPWLKVQADAAGVIITDMAGDQPAVIMDLIDEVRLLGFRPLLAGNIKSLLDHRRTPETQRAFAEAAGQRPKMITSFADGTKIAAEMAVVANATGFGVAARGMLGPRVDRVEQAPDVFDLDALLERPIVDYILGAEPSFGIFVLGYEDDPLTGRYMKFYKMGEGPVFTFYRPFHLGPLETVQTVARAVLLHDAAIAPIGAPVTEVVAIAKRDLRAGEVLDGIGGFMAYGMIENASTARAEDLLPMGLTDGATLLRDVGVDAALTFEDVRLPADRLAERLWREQAAHFGAAGPPPSWSR